MTAAKQPKFVYASSREEAQRLLDESYLEKFYAMPADKERRVIVLYVVGILLGVVVGFTLATVLWGLNEVMPK